MSASEIVFIIGGVFEIMALIHLNMHADDALLGEGWDSDKNEKIYYCFLGPAVPLCLFIALALMIFDL